MITSGKFDGITVLHGSQCLRFYGTVPHGAKTRAVAVDVPFSAITKIMELVPKTGSIGHAVWHYENPSRELPCSVCKETI